MNHLYCSKDRRECKSQLGCDDFPYQKETEPISSSSKKKYTYAYNRAVWVVAFKICLFTFPAFSKIKNMFQALEI